MKEQLSREYHRSTFSIAFNNAKRQLYRETNRTHSPTKPFSYFVPMQAPQVSAPGSAQKGRKGETLSDQIQRELQQNLQCVHKQLEMQKQRAAANRAKQAEPKKEEKKEEPKKEEPENKSALQSFGESSFITDAVTVSPLPEPNVYDIPNLYNAETADQLMFMEKFLDFSSD